jgi:hypothetical protein
MISIFIITNTIIIIIIIIVVMFKWTLPVRGATSSDGPPWAPASPPRRC